MSQYRIDLQLDLHAGFQGNEAAPVLQLNPFIFKSQHMVPKSQGTMHVCLLSAKTYCIKII